MRVSSTTKKTIIITLFSVLGATGCGHSHGEVDSILGLQGDPEVGHEMFDQTCGNASCHGADGASGPAPDLFVAVPDHDDEALAGVIKYGTGNMPAQQLTDQEIADVLAHCRDHFQ